MNYRLRSNDSNGIPAMPVTNDTYTFEPVERSIFNPDIQSKKH